MVVVVVVVVVVSTTARMSPQMAFVALGSLLIAPKPWLQPVKGKLSLTALAGFLLKHLHQMPWSSGVSFSYKTEHMLQIADCPASDGQLGPPLFLEQGVVPTELRCHDYMAVTMRCALCTQTRAKDD